ncbi:hypothetical protein D1224_04685 [Henriciella barbarensis]|uniref:Uncharacterized protein n=1 Tax=Henriciella barbarensis TaxID=86342 RepID=A0A399QZS2_9PROT|nr:hypothetical protein [Henriciella barbarensis]RIJ23565.1 hypothetical protein D1224_04685 [Henriciella barbarensis]
MRALIASALIGAGLTSGCTVAKVTGEAAALPFKGAYHGTRAAGTGLYYTGRGAYAVGKGAYHIGKFPIEVADDVLDTSARVLTLTVITLNAAGQVSAISKDIAAASLYAELAALESSASVMEVIVSVAS